MCSDCPRAGPDLPLQQPDVLLSIFRTYREATFSGRCFLTFLNCDAPPDNLVAVDVSLFHYQYIHMVSGGLLPPTWLHPGPEHSPCSAASGSDAANPSLFPVPPGLLHEHLMCMCRSCRHRHIKVCTSNRDLKPQSRNKASNRA